MHPLIFIDVETTGLDPTVHTIIELALIRRDRDGSESVFHTRIKPTEQDLDVASQTALAINGYRRAPELWENAPSHSEALAELLGFLRGSRYGTWVGHNVLFDVRFLTELLDRELSPEAAAVVALPWRKIDTVQLAAEHLQPMGLTRFGLDSIRRWLGWSGKNAHTALVDVAQTRRLFDLLWRLGPLRWLALRSCRFWNRFVRRTALPRSPLRPGEL
mgnify:CR=1 FL=1